MIPDSIYKLLHYGDERQTGPSVGDLNTKPADSPQELRGTVTVNTGRGEKREMSDLSREEIELRLQRTEDRMDRRVEKIENKIDAFLAQVVERDKRMDLMLDAAQKSAEKAEGLKTTLWVTAVSTMVTVIIAVAGTVIASFYANQSSNIAIVQATLSAFQQGQATPQPSKPK